MADGAAEGGYTAPLDRDGAAGLAAAVVSIVFFAALVAPALWNGYPLLQFDTGGYLARWYEGYLVPSRSTTYGIFLHAGEMSRFWLNVAAQAWLAVFTVNVTLRVLGVRAFRARLMIVLWLSAATALPWLASILLTDILAGTAVLAMHLLVAERDRLSRGEMTALACLVAFAASSHGATFAILVGLGACGWIAWPFARRRLSLAGLATASAAIAAGAALLLAANFALSGRVAWTPGGYGIAFGRMLEDGIVKRYLDDNCARVSLKLCPHRDALPKTADEFLWSNSVFNDLGRFNGLGEEMRFVVIESLARYPLAQVTTATTATARQLAMVATGYGVHNQIWHTYTIMERFIPAQVATMRRAAQQRGNFDFTPLNLLHVPVAYLSMVCLVGMLMAGAWRGRLDAVTLAAATVTLTILGNAFVCGALSGPHDRYGSRVAWPATLVVAIAIARWWREGPRGDGSIAPR